MVASSDPCWIQGGFSTLLGLFYRLGLNNNVYKAVEMVVRLCQAVFRLCQAVGTQSEAAYGRRIMGTGTLYWEKQQDRIQCTEYREYLALGFLAGHMQEQHRK